MSRLQQVRESLMQRADVSIVNPSPTSYLLNKDGKMDLNPTIVVAPTQGILYTVEDMQEFMESLVQGLVSGMIDFRHVPPSIGDGEGSIHFGEIFLKEDVQKVYTTKFLFDNELIDIGLATGERESHTKARNITIKPYPCLDLARDIVDGNSSCEHGIAQSYLQERYSQMPSRRDLLFYSKSKPEEVYAILAGMNSAVFAARWMPDFNLQKQPEDMEKRAERTAADKKKLVALVHDTEVTLPIDETFKPRTMVEVVGYKDECQFYRPLLCLAFEALEPAGLKVYDLASRELRGFDL